MNIDELTKETILLDEVFEEIFLIDDAKERTKYIVQLKEKAKQLCVFRSFQDLFKAFQSEYLQRFKTDGSNIMRFTESPLPNLHCGKWECNDFGVTKTILINMQPQKITACSHPILPVERLVNVDTETEKIKLAYFKDGYWQSVTCDRSTVANKSNIIVLSDRGIEVNSENSKDLVSYIADVVSLNMKDIPVYKSISRLGWVNSDFAPYLKSIKYDGDNAYKDMYEAIRTCGSYEEWKNTCVELRKNKIAHIMLATSFAAPLIDKLGTLSYIVHVWGGTGAGKTVGLMMAMSVWGDPEIGKLVRSLNSTQVALARMAAFLHDLPFAGDELQTIKNRWDNFDNLIMYLTEGLDRGRGKAYGGVEELKEWNCNFLFTGEEPVTKSASGGGAKNRVIEIECIDKVVENGNLTSNFFRGNYGWAGREYIENLPGEKELQERYREINKEILEKTDTTDKQAMAMSTILLADELATKFIFKDNNAFKVEDIKEYLQSQKDVDVAARAYDWIVNWVERNRIRFTLNGNTGETWGRIDENYTSCMVNKDVLDEQLRKAGFDYHAVIRKLAERKQIEKNSQGRSIHQTRVFGVKGNYIKLKFEESGNQEINEDELPF